MADRAPAVSQTHRALEELQLHGWRSPTQDVEFDPRPLPDAQAIAACVFDLFDALAVALTETRLEPDLEDLMWSAVNLFHRAAERARAAAGRQRAGAKAQPEGAGRSPEIRSVELMG